MARWKSVSPHWSHSIIPRLISQERREPHCSAAELQESCFLPLNSTRSKLSLERNTLSGSLSLDLSVYSHKYGRDIYTRNYAQKVLMYQLSSHHLRAVLSTGRQKQHTRLKTTLYILHSASLYTCQSFYFYSLCFYMISIQPALS